jgi:trimethylamine:corrinoid methyltransferase-like protein
MGGLISPQGARDVFEMGVVIAGSADALRERPSISTITSRMLSPRDL